MDNLQDIAAIIPEIHAAIFRPEDMAAACEAARHLDNEDARETARQILTRRPGTFYKGESAAIMEDLTAGKLIDPPHEIYDLSDQISADIDMQSATPRRTPRDGDEGEPIISRFIDDRDDRLFRRRRRPTVPFRTATILANFAFVHNISISKFGFSAAAVCATADAFNRAGYTCNIYAIDGASLGGGDSRKAINAIRIATAGTPANLSQIWTYTRPEVSRRIYHAISCLTLSHWGIFNPGLGFTYDPPSATLRRICGGGPIVSIEAELIQGCHNADDIARVVRNAIAEATNTTTPQED